MKTLKATMDGAYEKAQEHLKATAVRSEELYKKRVRAGVSGRGIGVVEQPGGAEGEVKKAALPMDWALQGYQKNIARCVQDPG